MSERRKLPLARKLFSLLPARIRFEYMRNQLKITSQLDSKFEFRIARTQEELAEAYRILHETYCEMGYSKPEISGMRIVKYFALPSTTTLIALYEKKVIGTISIIRREAFGLPMESAFNLSEFVDRGEVIAEVSSLAIDKKFRQNRGSLFLPLLKYFWQIVEQYMTLDSIVITVNPSMSDFYEGFLSFKRLKQAEIADYAFANGNPGVGLYLNVKQAPKIFAKLYGHKSEEKNLYRYFVDLKLPHFTLPERHFKKSSDPAMTPPMLNYFFNLKSDVFSKLSVEEKMGLASVYPADYAHVLPWKRATFDRNKTRFSSNLRARVWSQGESEISVVNVQGDGIRISSRKKINL